jgi:hypothetical protein
MSFYLWEYYYGDAADHPWLWHDPNGPREEGFIPAAQLNYIFNRNIPCASGPMTPMKTEMDKMEDLSHWMFSLLPGFCDPICQ